MNTKNLLIMRHAKSEWKQPGETDHQRRLNKRGQTDVPLMAEFLLEQGLVPQQILHSTAQRTTMTAAILVDALQTPNRDRSPIISAAQELYLAPWRKYIDVLIDKAGHDHDTVMVLGHNPGVEDLVDVLTGQWKTMPTCGLAHVAIDIEGWYDMANSQGKARLVGHWGPNDI